MAEIKIGFDPIEGIYVEEIDGVRTNKKFVTIEDLRSILLCGITVQTPLLPTGCRFYAEHDGKTFIVLEVPNIRRRILFHERGGEMHEYDIPLPYTIFGLVLSGGAIVGSFCLTSKTPIMGDDTMLYRFPLGNVYGDLRICWGNTRLPSVRNAVQVSGIPQMFYAAPFNGDLMGDQSFHGHGEDGLYLRQFIEHLADCQFFPNDRLVEWGNFSRFKEYLLRN